MQFTAFLNKFGNGFKEKFLIVEYFFFDLSFNQHIFFILKVKLIFNSFVPNSIK